jgi:hypothetical protein
VNSNGTETKAKYLREKYLQLKDETPKETADLKLHVSPSLTPVGEIGSVYPS